MSALLTRRSLLGGLAALLAAPAIVRAQSLMPIKVPPLWVPPQEAIIYILGTDQFGRYMVERMVITECAPLGLAPHLNSKTFSKISGVIVEAGTRTIHSDSLSVSQALDGLENLLPRGFTPETAKLASRWDRESLSEWPA